ncbi:glycosyltransferase [Bacillus sp. ILBB4]|nr:glycosyltransferase [Bacillus sp. ILBB4]
MKILVLNVAASSGGALSILNDFYNYVKENDQNNDWVFLLSTPQLKERENIKIINTSWIKKSWIHRLYWDLVEVRKIINNIKPDIILSLQNTGALGVDIPQIIYLHQLIPFQETKNFSFLKKGEFMYAVYQKIIGRLIKTSITSANYTIVQTDWLKNILIKKTKLNNDNILVIPPSLNIPFCSEKEMEKVKENINNKKTFFYPAKPLIYKNHMAIINGTKFLVNKGYSDFLIELTIDANGDKCPNTILEEMRFAKRQFNLTGFLEREEVLNKYKNSILIMPSYIESFCLPLEEAKRMGGMILAPDLPYAKEVLKNYPNVLFFNPFDPKSLADQMERILNNDFNYRTMKMPEHKNVNSWDKLLDLLKKIEKTSG